MSAELKFCSDCQEWTFQDWQVDKDSDKDEPQFYLICQECSNQNPAERSKFYKIKLPESQKRLNL